MGNRVLVVEDEVEIADFLVRGLREEGFDVEHAADGESALRSIGVGPWDAILLDWWLPGEDGLDVLKKIRGAGMDTPVLFLTARDAVADRVVGLDSGADDYLCKPFAFDELLARLRVLVRRHERATPGLILTHGDIQVDLATHRALRAEKPIDLTAKEQALLIFFLQNPGQVLSRAKIYDHVWDEHYDGLSNTLEVHVMELRRKLESNGPRVIHTLRGRGYVLGKPVEAERA